MRLSPQRRPRSLSNHLLRGLANAFVAGIAMEAAVLIGVNAPDPAPDTGSATWAQAEQTPPALTRLMQRYDCSTVGYGDELIPEGAIIRVPAGRFRVVSFDRGWAVHNGDAPGDLIAVCLEPRR